MGAPKIMDKAKVITWMREGKSNKEIAELLHKDGIEITPNGLAMFRSRRNLPALQEHGNELLPWTLAPEHKNYWAAKMLRMEAKRRRGESLTETQRRTLTNFLVRLERDDVVVHYDPRTPEGFFYVPREPGDGELVRKPRA